MLAGLRRLWAGFTATVLVLSGIGALVADVESTVPAVLPVGLVLAVGVATAAAVEAVGRGLEAAAPTSDAQARGEVRSRLAIQIAIAEAPVLLAFALAFALGPGWVVLVGGAVSVATLLRIRPGEEGLRRLERAWRARGHDVSALRAAEDEPDRSTEPEGSEGHEQATDPGHDREP